MNDQEDQPHAVVVGYDGSASARVAVRWAAETARQLGTRLTIVHSCGLSMTPGLSAADGAQVESRLREAADGVVRQGADQASRVLEASQIATQYWLGSPAGQLIEASRNADLLVVGSRGHGRLLTGLLGSTSYAVTAHARCPVVVVRGRSQGQAGDVETVRPGPEHPVIVGVDDSEPAQRALDAAAAWAEREHAVLHVVHVAHSVSMEAWTYAETAVAGTEQTHAVYEEAQRTVTQLANRARADHPILEVTTEVLYGDAGQSLAEVATHAGLVVVGSRGRGGFSGMLLGSVSHRVIHDAVCPVLVVR